MIPHLNWRLLTETISWLLIGLAAFLIAPREQSLQALSWVISLLILRLVVAFVVRRLFTISVEPYKRLVVVRNGAASLKGPGDVFVVPLRDKNILVDLREQLIAVPSDLICFTCDPAELAVRVDVFWNVSNPIWYVTRVHNIQDALARLIPGEVANILGTYQLIDLLRNLDVIGTSVQTGLAPKVCNWGIEVTRVLLRQVMPSPNVREAIDQRMVAEQQTLAESGIKKVAQAKAKAIDDLSQVAKGVDQQTIEKLEALINLLPAVGGNGGTPSHVKLLAF